MKKLLVVLLVVLTVACKEQGPIIEFGNKVIEDSSYKAPDVPAAQKHNVLVEEFTGATCTNCPDARDLLAGINEANNHRLIVVGIHPNGIGQANPVHDSKYDFRTEKGTKIKDIYYGNLGGIPAGGFDRVVFNGQKVLLQNQWAGAIDSRLAVSTPVNLNINSNYDASSGKATIEVGVTFTEQVSGQLKMSLVIIEDSLVDKQEFPFKEVQDDYVFMHVFRDFLTAINGDPFLDDTDVKAPGLVFLRRYKNLEINPDWIAKNCKIIAFVHHDDGSNNQVLQTAEVHLTE